MIMWRGGRGGTDGGEGEVVAEDGIRDTGHGRAVQCRTPLSRWSEYLGRQTTWACAETRSGGRYHVREG